MFGERLIFSGGPNGASRGVEQAFRPAVSRTGNLALATVVKIVIHPAPFVNIPRVCTAAAEADLFFRSNAGLKACSTPFWDTATLEQL